MSNNSSLFGTDSSSLKKRFQFFLDFGYSEKETISIISNSPTLFDCGTSIITKKFEEFRKIGFKNSDIIKITYILPELFFNSVDIINEKFLYLIEFGYTEVDVINIIKKVPIILKDFYLDHLSTKIKCLVELGFSSKDIIMITCNNPYILLYSDESIIDKFNNFLFFEFSLDEIRKIIIDTPILLGYDTGKIKSRIKYYESINLKDVILTDSNILIYPIELIEKRYSFISKSKDINKKNYDLLFLNDKDFTKKFKISKDKLLKGEF